MIIDPNELRFIREAVLAELYRLTTGRGATAKALHAFIGPDCPFAVTVEDVERALAFWGVNVRSQEDSISPGAAPRWSITPEGMRTAEREHLIRRG
jgi:hypothetical protein